MINIDKKNGGFLRKRSIQLQNIHFNWIIQEYALFDTTWEVEM